MKIIGETEKSRDRTITRTCTVTVGRRGMFFTIIAFLLVFLVLLAISFDSVKRYKERSMVTAVRLDTMNNFVSDLEDDLSRALYISGFRSLLSLEQQVISSGQFLNDTEGPFLEAVLDGTVYNASAPLMENSTFTQWIGRIEQQASLVDVNVSIVLNNVSLEQPDPWTLQLRANVLFNISDLQKTSSWTRQEDITARITIIGHEDPLYAVNSYGLATNIIIPANITDFVNLANNDTTNLQIHVNNSYYIESTQAPSFLMRLQGNLSPSPKGIESIVNVNELIDQHIPAMHRSSVDYLYFGNDTMALHTIHNMSDTTDFTWFLLDDAHLSVYNCTGLVLT